MISDRRRSVRSRRVGLPLATAAAVVLTLVLALHAQQPPQARRHRPTSRRIWRAWWNKPPSVRRRSCWRTCNRWASTPFWVNR